MIFISKHLVPNGYLGMTVYPFVVLKTKALLVDVVLMNHERIHLKQQLELLIIPFFIWYSLEFIIRLMIYKNWRKAYRNVSFEREAYCNESNLDFLKERKFWDFLKYLRVHEI
jgi:hypothetical protein